MFVRSETQGQQRNRNQQDVRAASCNSTCVPAIETESPGFHTADNATVAAISAISPTFISPVTLIRLGTSDGRAAACSRRNRRRSIPKNRASSEPPTISVCIHKFINGQEKSTPRRKPTKRGGSPIGVN